MNRKDRASIRDGYWPSQSWEETARGGGAPEAKEDPLMPSPTPTLKEIQDSGPRRPNTTVRVPENLM